MRFTIRRAKPEDGGGILACLRAAFQPYQSSYTPKAYEDTVLTVTSLRERLTTMLVFVATVDQGTIAGTIGCAATVGGEGHLRGMAVSPEWRGSGVADELLQRAESELRTLGCNRLTLDTTAPLKPAVRFYERHGFRATGKVVDFFGMPLFEYAKPL